ncbi:hypothetical protein Sango_2013600 [Sesamum angolense]|uniref:Uncharacterized protein n=1 Tax=Sesamum angolense TaxID=2727404 RepID=A0AAE2BP08_9LAMI|nr:hypothetical protein Sango_2013600 [Sesamum angolense]
MADADSSSRKLGDPTRKRTRRRSHTRKASLSSTFINMAEARREIVNALQLHRSSSASVVRIHQNPSLLSNSRNHNYYNQLTESMPIPQPTWSTTAPAVSTLCAPVEVLEVEWYDNQYSSSYAWWIGFLNSLDGKSGGGKEFMESCEGACLEFDTRDDVEKSAPDANDQSTSTFTDEWLIFPAAAEEQAEST